MQNSTRRHVSRVHTRSIQCNYVGCTTTFYATPVVYYAALYNGIVKQKLTHNLVDHDVNKIIDDSEDNSGDNHDDGCYDKHLYTSIYLVDVIS